MIVKRINVQKEYLFFVQYDINIIVHHEMTERAANGRIHTTEWEDVQYQFGNKVGQYICKEADILQQRKNDEKPDDYATFQPFLEKIQDTFSVASGSDDDELAMLRKERLQTLRSSQKPRKNIIETSYEKYIENVTERSLKQGVLLVIYDPSISHCQKLLYILDRVDNKELNSVAVVAISTAEARLQIEEHELPCVVLYWQGTVVRTLHGSSVWGGDDMDEHKVLLQLKQMPFVR